MTDVVNYVIKITKCVNKLKQKHKIKQNKTKSKQNKQITHTNTHTKNTQQQQQQKAKQTYTNNKQISTRTARKITVFKFSVAKSNVAKLLAKFLCVKDLVNVLVCQRFNNTLGTSTIW